MPTSSTAATRRPRQVTMAAWSIMVGSVVVVISGYETITAVHSLETQEAIERALASAPAEGLGLDVGGVQQLIKIGCMVAAGCATAAALLGYQVLQCNRTARVVLSVLAVPLFLGGMATGGFFSSLVVVAVAILWLHPARAWFNGTWRPDADRAGLGEPNNPFAPRGGSSPADAAPPTTPPAGPPVGPVDAPTPGVGPGTAPEVDERPPTQARPVQGFGASPSPYAVPPPVAPYGMPHPPYASPGWPVGSPPPRPPRPAALVWAAVLTWVFGGLALLSTAAAVFVLATEPGPVLDELHRQQPDLAAQGVTDDVIVTITYVMSALVAVWAVVAMVLAGLAFAGFSWARFALVACVAASAVLLLVSVAVGQILLVLPLAAAVATCTFLLRPEVRRWYTAVRGPMGS